MSPARPAPSAARASLAGQFASAGEDPTGAENLVMIARQPGHPRWRAKTRAGELLAAFGLAKAAGRSGRTPAVCAGGWPGRDPELVFLDAASPCPRAGPHARS